MSIAKDMVILAVTKMPGGVCTAGIDANGTWVRPVRPTVKRIGECDTITDYCLLSMAVFHDEKSHLVSGGVSRVWLLSHAPAQPHIEDWRLDLRYRPQLLRKLSENEQAELLAHHSESDLSALIPDEDRSLAICLPKSFSFSFAMNQSGTDISVRPAFTLEGRHLSDRTCPDLCMRALGRNLFENSSSVPCSLSQADFERRGKCLTYLALGLSRRFHGKH